MPTSDFLYEYIEHSSFTFPFSEKVHITLFIMNNLVGRK